MNLWRLAKSIAAGVLGCELDHVAFDAGLFSNPTDARKSQ